MREINQDQCVRALCRSVPYCKCVEKFLIHYKSPAPVFRKEKQKILHPSVPNLH